MKIIKVENRIQGSQEALKILQEVISKGGKTLGLATGSTPIEFYNVIKQSKLDFSDFTSVNLDEYVGLGIDNKQSYAYFMHSHLFEQKPFKHSYLPNGLAKDINEEVIRYEAILESTPVDFQILGIGQNGHIGFNEPGTSFDSTVHVVDLTESTIKANARFFNNIEEVPKQAISMGIKNIISAKTIVLMAYGEDKADAINKMINGPLTEKLPASILKNHPNVFVIVDKTASIHL